MEDIHQTALRRALRSISCLPFKKYFYEQVDKNPMSSEDLCSRANWQDYVFVQFGKERLEEYFVWMTKLGILRREVDGQGLTSRVRLTPLGRKAILMVRNEVQRAGIRERIAEILRRHQKTW